MARERDLEVLAGRSVPGATPVPYRPLTEAFLGAFRDAAPLEVPELAGFREQVGRLIPAWRTGESGVGDESPVLIGEAAVRLLRLVGRGCGGALLVLEDLHWADAETLAVVEYLADVLLEEPSPCICTTRPEDAAVEVLTRLRRVPGVTILGLDRLTPDGIERVIHSCLGVHDSPAEVVESIAANSEGNPFLIEELLAGLVASGSLCLEDGRWTTTGRVTPSIPFGFGDSVAQRSAASTMRLVGWSVPPAHSA